MILSIKQHVLGIRYLVSCILYPVFSLGTKYKIQNTALILLLATCYLLPATCNAQTNVPPAQVINTAGKTVVVGANYYGYNIGEPIVGTTSSYKYYTQGFLQPDYNIGTGFNAQIFVFAETCQGANDGSIVANTHNGHGTVQYSLIPSPAVGDTTSAIYNLSPGTYSLVISDSVGNSLSKTIIILPSTNICPIIIHHAFSPNKDGLNDTYIIEGIENYPQNHVYIFNRWGQRMWDKTGYNNTSIVWDGTDYKGGTLDSGTYFYIIEIDGNTKKPYKGWVEITK